MSETTKRPIIGITLGDPSGIGPEITAKALSKREIYDICRPLVVGDYDVMVQGREIAGVGLEVHSIQEPGEGGYEGGTIDLLDLDNVDVDSLPLGEISEVAGRASLEYIDKVIDLALAEEIDATVTNPIHKEAIHRAGSDHPGHTEIYRDRTDSERVAMMLVKDDFRVVHVSTHVSLREACELVKKRRILEVIRLADEAIKNLGIPHPKIAVAGLNPHGGEGGLFGDEELREIGPAVVEARDEEIDAEGPLPPDTAFAKVNGGKYDIGVAMYHDQGHIPAKLVGFIWDKSQEGPTEVSGVNVTLGLPIPRTSVDHGTAFDKAGEGRALPDSLTEAIRLAARFKS